MDTHNTNDDDPPKVVASNESDPNASFYGEDIFDDMIAKVMDAADKNNSKVRVQAPSPVIEIDGTPSDDRSINDNNNNINDNDIETGGSPGNDDSTNTGSDVASLDSEEISGESDISEVEEKEKSSYYPQPLIHDDESTIDMRPPAAETQTVSSYVDQLNQQERRKGKLVKAGVCSFIVAIAIGVVLAIVMTRNDDSSVTKPLSYDDYVTASSPSSPQPVKPIPPITTVDNQVQLTFDNIPDGYRMPDDDRTSIINFLDTLIGNYILTDKYLGDSFELLGVTNGYDKGSTSTSRGTTLRVQPPRRRLESLNLPLLISVKGPSNISPNVIQAKVIQMVEDRSKNIMNYVKAYDYATFKDATLSVRSYDLKDLIIKQPVSTKPPTGRPTTASPTVRPQTLAPPTLKPVVPISSKSPITMAPQTPVTRPPVRPKPPPPITSSPITASPSSKPITPSPTPKLIITLKPVTGHPSPRPTTVWVSSFV